MALFISKSAQDHLHSLPESAREKALAVCKWIYANRDEALLVALGDDPWELSHGFEAGGRTYRMTLDFKSFPPNLYVLSVIELGRFC